MTIRLIPGTFVLLALTSVALSPAAIAQRKDHGNHGSHGFRPESHRPFPGAYGKPSCRPLKGYGCSNGGISKGKGPQSSASSGSRLCLDGDTACYQRNGNR